MDSKYQHRFLLIDFGHPMSSNTIKNITNSLENVLLLNLAHSENVKETNIEISVLSPDFVIIHDESESAKNYNVVAKILSDVSKKVEFSTVFKQTGERFTVQEFKSLLSSSLEAVSAEIKKKFTPGKMLNEELIEIAVVSRKTAWVLADILASVISKFEKLSAENFKVVQILNETQHKTQGKNSRIDCVFCLDDPCDLDGFFKDWLLNPQHHLRISLSKDANLEIECEIENCVLNPIAFCSERDAIGDIQYKKGDVLIGTSFQVRSLEIINRLPVSGVCPTLVFGTPRRVRAARGRDSQTNSSIFKQLCRELNRTGEGLLAKSPLPNNPVTFHFLTSDGDMILVNDVAPNELHLPKREGFPKSVRQLTREESDDSVVRASLQKIKLLDEFNPRNFSSGLYKFIKQTERSKNSSELTSKEKNRKRGEEVEKKSGGRKRAKSGSEKELQNVHPALLSPGVVRKHRKVSEHAFNLPELGKEFAP